MRACDLKNAKSQREHSRFINIEDELNPFVLSKHQIIQIRRVFSSIRIKNRSISVFFKFITNHFALFAKSYPAGIVYIISYVEFIQKK